MAQDQRDKEYEKPSTAAPVSTDQVQTAAELCSQLVWGETETGAAEDDSSKEAEEVAAARTAVAALTETRILERESGGGAGLADGRTVRVGGWRATRGHGKK